nr:MAG TPA: hypothetical protein [Bacteriophage sp.]
MLGTAYIFLEYIVQHAACYFMRYQNFPINDLEYQSNIWNDQLPHA